jgi:PKD repeat protein
VGNTLVVGGDFTQVQSPAAGSPILARNYVFAMNATTGAISTAFVPALNGAVEALVPSPDGQSVYVGGRFTSVNGQTQSRVVRLNLSNGQRTANYGNVAFNGTVRDLRLHPNGNLIAGGSFSTVGGQTRTSLVSLNATTGAVTPFINHAFVTTRDGARQVIKMDLSPDASRLVAIGNFTSVDGQARPQLVVLDTSGTTSTLANWATQFYGGACNPIFDTYMRDLDIDPTGRYVVVSTTGAYGGPEGPCDVIARWELDQSGTDQTPTWRNYTGGDTTYAVISTGAAVYAGGHMRWVNNPFAGDAEGPGAVPREGIVALDPQNGLPFSWNPGRARGVGTYEMIATPAGLWVGSDTDRIGGETRRKLAFLPLAGGTVPPPNVTGSLPNDVYQLGRLIGRDPSVLYRINAGGPALPSEDDGPDWAAGDSSPFVNTGNNAGWDTVPTLDPSVPSSDTDRAPRALFSSEKWDDGSDPEMTWSLPVKAGANLQVRLFFANRFSGTGAEGNRVFDVSIDGQTKLDDFDIVREHGDQVGAMEAFDVPSDGRIDISFAHTGADNPLINGIEIINQDVQAGVPASDPSVLYRVNAGGPALQSADDGPNWSAGTSTPFVNTGNNAGWDPVPRVNSSVPNSDDDRAPRALFDSEKWDSGEPPPMTWQFPVPSGTNVQVRLYFANRCGCTSPVGSRVFDVSLEGNLVLDNLDLAARYGDQVGAMESFNVVSDGTIDVEFGHVVENPLINGIEIINRDVAPGGGDATFYNQVRRQFVTTSGTPEATETTTGAEAWRFARGAFLVDSTLYTGWVDGTLYARQMSAPGQFGPRTTVNLYGGPFGAEIPSLTGLSYRDGRIYYTVEGSNQLYFRYFTSESRVVGAARYDAGGDMAALSPVRVQGMFFSGNHLYFADADSGSLYRVGFENGSVTGPASLVDDTIDWRSRGLFVWNRDPGPRPNALPTAIATATCEADTCDFSGSESTDSDGSIESYEWDFGDDTTSTQVAPTHTYAESGNYTVTLTVTDNRGGKSTSTVSAEVTVAPNQPPTAQASGSCAGAVCDFSSTGSSDPDGSIAGYAWDFGDGRTSTQANPTHTYGQPGDYTATLTVKDNRGATASTTTQVQVQAPQPAIEFRAAASGRSNATSVAVTTPGNVQAGDTLLLFVTANRDDITFGNPGAGWSLVGNAADTGMLTRVWARTAVASDAGTVVRPTVSASAKLDAQLLAYAGTATQPVAGFAGAAEPAISANHTTPQVTNAPAGAWVVSYWADKTGETVSWTPPASVTERQQSIGSGNGRITSLTADGGSGVLGGTVGGLTATASSANGKATMTTVVLAPAG